MSRGSVEEDSDLGGCSQFPTLFQFLASAYNPIPLRQLRHVRDHGLDEEYAKLVYAFAYKKEGEPAASDAEIRKALAACVREYSSYRTIMPHPDFSTIRIRRLPEKEGPDEIIEVPLGKFIAECTADTPAAECRKHDIELMAGDIVELPALYDRLDEPFTGFDEATARFFSKTLSYEFKIAPRAGAQPVPVVKRWRSPRFYDTSAGPVGVINTKDAIHPDPDHDYPPFYYELLRIIGTQLTTSKREQIWLRNAATVDETSLGKSRSQFPRTGIATAASAASKRKGPVREQIVLTD